MNIIFKFFLLETIFFPFVYVTSLHDAIADGDSDRLSEILAMSEGAGFVEEVDACGYTPLHRAAMKGSLISVKILTKYGAALNATTPLFERTALHLAALEGHSEVVGFLWSVGVKFCDDSLGRTPLHLAAEKGHVSAVHPKFLHDVAKPDIYGWTPLHLAALNDHVEMAKFLLLNGADILAKDLNGRSPNKVARAAGSKNMLEFFARSTA